MREQDIYTRYQHQSRVQIEATETRYGEGLKKAKETLTGLVDLWLDIGSNRGFGLSELRLDSSGRIFAVDVEEKYLCEALKKNPQIEGAVMDGRHLGFSNDSFSVVSAFEVIEHLKKPGQEELLDEIARVLKPEGVLVLSTPNKVISGKRRMSADHQRELTCEELKGLLEKKFEVLEMLGQGFFNQSLYHRLFRKARENPLIVWVHHNLLPWAIVSRLRDKTLTSQDWTVRKPKEDEIERGFFVVCRKKS